MTKRFIAGFAGKSTVGILPLYRFTGRHSHLCIFFWFCATTCRASTTHFATSLDMSGKLRAYVTKLSQMDAEHLAGHDCAFARRVEFVRKFQADVALKKLELSSNPASDDAKQAVKDAVNQRKPT